MATVQMLTRRFERVFEPQQAVVLAETITEAYSDARPSIRQFLEEHNILVVQTFEW